MNAVDVVESATTGPLTWAEIRERYPDQWVCMVEIGWMNDTDFEFTNRREPLGA